VLKGHKLIAKWVIGGEWEFNTKKRPWADLSPASPPLSGGSRA